MVKRRDSIDCIRVWHNKSAEIHHCLPTFSFMRCTLAGSSMLFAVGLFPRVRAWVEWCATLTFGGFTHRKNAMNWFKIKIQERNDDYTYAGSSPHSLDSLVEQATQGKFIRFDDLVYMDRGEIKDWSTWDMREIPTVHINPKVIIAIMQFKVDPRTITK